MLGLGENARWSEICCAYSRLRRVWDPARYRSGSEMEKKARRKEKELSDAYLRLQEIVAGSEAELNSLELPLIRAGKNS